MSTAPPAVTLGVVKWLESTRARIRAIDPFRVDVALAALFVIGSAIELSLLESHGHNRAITIAAGVIASSALAFRRRDPLLAAAIYSVAALAQALLDGFLTNE